MALTLTSARPCSFHLRVLDLGIYIVRRVLVLMWTLWPPPSASLLFQQGIWLAQSSATVFFFVWFFAALCPTFQRFLDWFLVVENLRSLHFFHSVMRKWQPGAAVTDLFKAVITGQSIAAYNKSEIILEIKSKSLNHLQLHQLTSGSASL